MRDGNCIYNTFEVSFVLKSHPKETVMLLAVAYFVRVPDGQTDAGKIKAMTVYRDLGPLKAKLMGDEV